MSQDLLEQKELWNVGAGATTTTIPMITQSGLSVALSTASQNQLVGSTFDCAIGATRCMAVVNSVSASGVLTLDSPLPSAPTQGTQFVLTPTDKTELTGSKAMVSSTPLTLANAVAITDTNVHYYDGAGWTAASPIAIPNWNNYNRRSLMIRNSLDQAIVISLLSNMRGGYDALLVGASQTVQSVSIPSGGTYKPTLINNADITSLNGISDTQLSVAMSMKAATAPTTGSVTINLQMWAE